MINIEEVLQEAELTYMSLKYQEYLALKPIEPPLTLKEFSERSGISVRSNQVKALAIALVNAINKQLPPK